MLAKSLLLTLTTRTAYITLLYWWAFKRAVRTVNTTVTLEWFQDGFTTITFIKPLARIRWHLLSLLVATFRTSNG